jgi:hypothetical protein
MTTYYKATFSDGTVVRRITASRKYTHAWLARWKNREPDKWGPTSECHGFCGSIVNAYNTLPRYTRPGMMVLSEVAPVFEVTRQEYQRKPGVGVADADGIVRVPANEIKGD